MSVQFNPSITQGAAFQRSSGVENFGRIISDKRSSIASLEGGQRKSDTVSNTAQKHIDAFMADYSKLSKNF